MSIIPETGDGMAVGPGDTVYLPFDGNPMGVGRGIVAIDPTGQCTVVTGDNGAGAFGSGESLSTSRLNGPVLADNRLCSVAGINAMALIYVDLTAVGADKGRRVVVSSPTTGTGPDMYTEGLTRDISGAFWTWSSHFPEAGLVSINPSNGDRVESPLTWGPASYGRGPALWAPFGGSLLVGESYNAIVLIETATRASNILSY